MNDYLVLWIAGPPTLPVTYGRLSALRDIICILHLPSPFPS